jgi:hypothetical protein
MIGALTFSGAIPHWVHAAHVRGGVSMIDVLPIKPRFSSPEHALSISQSHPTYESKEYSREASLVINPFIRLPNGGGVGADPAWCSQCQRGAGGDDHTHTSR